MFGVPAFAGLTRLKAVRGKQDGIRAVNFRLTDPEAVCMQTAHVKAHRDDLTAMNCKLPLRPVTFVKRKVGSNGQ